MSKQYKYAVYTNAIIRSVPGTSIQNSIYSGTLLRQSNNQQRAFAFALRYLKQHRKENVEVWITKNGRIIGDARRRFTFRRGVPTITHPISPPS